MFLWIDEGFEYIVVVFGPSDCLIAGGLERLFDFELVDAIVFLFAFSLIPPFLFSFGNGHVLKRNESKGL